MGPGGVGVWIIEVVVEAAAFGALQGRCDNQFRDGGDVAQFEQVAGHDEIPVILLDFLLQIGDAGASALQSFVCAHDSNVVPHDAADFVPIMIDYNEFIDVLRVAGLPGRERDVDGWFRIFVKAFGGAIRANERFEKGIAGQPVGAVQSRASHFADGVKSGNLRSAIDIGHDAPALVMRSRDDGDWLLGNVYSELEAGGINVREMFNDESGRLVRDVK